MSNEKIIIYVSNQSVQQKSVLNADTVFLILRNTNHILFMVATFGFMIFLIIPFLSLSYSSTPSLPKPHAIMTNGPAYCVIVFTWPVCYRSICGFLLLKWCSGPSQSLNQLDAVLIVLKFSQWIKSPRPLLLGVVFRHSVPYASLTSPFFDGINFVCCPGIPHCLPSHTNMRPV